MKTSVLFLFIIIACVVVLGFSGCTREKDEDLTDWSIPGLKKEVVETDEAVKPEEEEEQAIMESQPRTYVVKKGDSIIAIAKQHGISPRQLSEANNLALTGSQSIIYPGQKLIIPGGNKTIYYYEK